MSKPVGVKVGNYSKIIDLKKIIKIVSQFILLDFGKNEVPLTVNAKTGEFAIFFDNINIDDVKPTLTSGLEIKINDLHSEGMVTFKNIVRRK